MHLLCTIRTLKVLSSELDGDEPPHDPDDDDDGWPPFKKVGSFDPCSDDGRFVILKLAMCPVTSVLVVGGAGGQVMLFDLSKENLEKPQVNYMISLKR